MAEQVSSPKDLVLC